MTVASAAGVRKVRTRRAIPPKRVDPRQERRLTANNAITIVRRAPRKGPQTRWGRSSAGRASRSQCEGQGFDPPRLHQYSTPESKLDHPGAVIEPRCARYSASHKAFDFLFGPGDRLVDRLTLLRAVGHQLG